MGLRSAGAAGGGGGVSTTATPDRTVLKSLQHLIASVISNQKSNKVPSVCCRYGLESGTDEEAFRGKYAYVNRRLEGLSGEKILTIARNLQVDEPDFALREALRKYDEKSQPQISELTRRRIIAVLDTVNFSGELDEIEFIEKIMPIRGMSAPQDSMEKTMADFIVRHRIHNNDFTNNQILEIIGVLEWSQTTFFALLEEVTHPITRIHDQQKVLVQKINAWLTFDGFELQEVKKISGAPLFKVRTVKRGTPADAEISRTILSFNAADIHERWTEALNRRASDPRAAITSARTLLEDVCKWILTEAEKVFLEDEDLPGLYKRLAVELKLAPDQHTERVFKQILGSCQSIVESLGAVRNKLGDAHSQGPLRARPRPRHAELAVNLAGSMAQFLVATWEETKADRDGAKT